MTELIVGTWFDRVARHRDKSLEVDRRLSDSLIRQTSLRVQKPAPPVPFDDDDEFVPPPPFAGTFVLLLEPPHADAPTARATANTIGAMRRRTLPSAVVAIWDTYLILLDRLVQNYGLGRSLD